MDEHAMANNDVKYNCQKENRIMSTRFITNTALGIALFVAASLMLQVPFFQNYYVCLGYVVMAVYTYYFGAGCGVLVGSIGTLLYCLIISHMNGVIGWMLGNMLIAFLLHLAFEFSENWKSTTVKAIFWAVIMIVATLLGIAGVKSATETLLFKVPLVTRMAKNIYAFIGDAMALLLSIPVILLIDKVRERKI